MVNKWLIRLAGFLSQGGRVHSGQRRLAALIGASASRVNQVLNELAAEGIVRLTPDRRRATLVPLNA